MCIDDGRVVSNFVAQVGSVFLSSYLPALVMKEILKLENFTGIEETAINSIWGRQANKELPVCFRPGN